MGRSKSKARDFETTKPGENQRFAALYLTMLTSAAYKDLTPQAKNLYTYMKLQINPKTPAVKGKDSKYFYFNRAMYLKNEKYPNSYGLYTSTNKFKRDKDLLVSHGFIEEVEKNFKATDKTVYMFSDGWKTWTLSEDQEKKRAETRKKLACNLVKEPEV